MNRKLFIFLGLLFLFSSCYSQDLPELINRIELLELKVQELEGRINKENSANPSSNVGDGQKSIYSPYNRKGLEIPYSFWEKLSRGMSKSQVVNIIGEPIDINKTDSSAGITEYWHYNYAKNNSRSALTFNNEKLSSISFPDIIEDYK